MINNESTSQGGEKRVFFLRIGEKKVKNPGMVKKKCVSVIPFRFWQLFDVDFLNNR